MPDAMHFEPKQLTPSSVTPFVDTFQFPADEGAAIAHIAPPVPTAAHVPGPEHDTA
jgi:hypothetical protein